MREWDCIVICKKILAYVAQQLIPDPLHQLIIGTSVKLMDLGSEIYDDKRQGVQVSQYCIPLYVSYDGKPSDRAFAGLLVFSGQE